MAPNGVFSFFVSPIQSNLLTTYPAWILILFKTTNLNLCANA